ncbi:MAG: sterol desaturase family protein, partial [Gammaproteobacteria bacterium]
SVVEQETNSNFGFNLSCWDRLFGTYKQAPDAGHDGMTIGLYGLTEARQITWLPGLLDLPFRAERGDYALNRRDRDRPPS